MLDKLEILFEKYNFDYIYINPNNIGDLDFEYLPEEALADFSGIPNYLGTIKLNGNDVGVYFDKKIASDDVIFKYKNVKKERKSKLSNLLERFK